MNVAVVGASPKAERYSNQAVCLLLEYGHDVVPVNPGYDEIEGLPVAASVAELSAGDVDTVTLYMGPERSTALVPDLIALKPRRVICNPGAENPTLQAALETAGIDVVEACTLVLLRTGQF